MQSGNFFQFTKGGGGLIGIKKNVMLDGFAIVEHHLEKKDKTSGVVLETYPTKCFLKFDVHVEDQVEESKRHAPQYLSIGRLPIWRVQQLGETPEAQRLEYPGGFVPSLDNQNPASQTATPGAGPFFLIDGEKGVYEGEDYSIFMNELLGLGLNNPAMQEKFAQFGVAALNGIRGFLDDKAKPKTKKAAAAAALDPANAKADRTVPVLTKINAWPAVLTGGAAAPAASIPVAAAAAVAAPVAAAPVAAAPAAPAVAAAPTPPTANGSADETAIAKIKQVAVAGGGLVKRSELMAKAFPITSELDGPTRSAVMSKINDQGFVLAAAAAGHFLYDQGGDTIMVVG